MARTLNPSRRSLLAGAGLSALALTLAACGASSTGSSSTSGSAGSAEVSPGGRLGILTSGTDINWDPAKSQSMPVTSLVLVHRRLTTWSLSEGSEVEVVADLATDTGTVSEDGLSWTYTLKDGLFFEDGTAITSAHVKYGLERSFAPALAGGLGYHKTLLAGTEGYEGPFDGAHLDSIETPDDKTIVFHLRQTYGDWPWIVAQPAFSPVPEDKDDVATYARTPIASGPYRVEQYSTGVSATLVRNEHWSADTDDVRLALPDTIVFELGQDESTSIQRIIASAGDDAHAFCADRVAAAQLAQVSGNAEAAERLATPAEGGPLQYLAINTERVTDVEVRQAISRAVDKTAVVSALGGQLGASAATTYIAPGIPGRVEYDLYPTDVEAVAATLAGKEVGELILLAANDTATQAVAQAVQQALTEAGLRVTIDPQESEVVSERATQGDGSTYDLAIGSWNADFPSASAYIQPLFASSEIGGGGYNISRYSDPEVDAAIEEAIATLDPAEAGAKWAAIDQRVAAQAPVVPLANRRNSFLAGSGVTDFFVESYPAYPNYLVVGVSA
ncbi:MULTISPECIES: ABC transporter substrate-binding protein [unclassified Actinomyces]|uniref:ABC transporter substrate-binding protein n=1 Tax=unclassified Actinomyces TaxID=2609248 RepID=UPI0020180C97|nr:MULTISPECIES: ABC transporter substrate-binding protein [unclassified Actinomyces]MCL3777245.1 ABC transporter substrate-binding protein [Actinomyces sp. AC-20-1]MCL3789521.1 ABC transporter substrate-binding protein [Actinomyces sp. 187325]MCL3792644.1 ABC transporter substrate-binding protein [Actinomyces sp. 186855]MCL3795116.1 ABC transporter substrate-binding protein [Actinomyces sp. 217892]